MSKNDSINKVISLIISQITLPCLVLWLIMAQLLDALNVNLYVLTLRVKMVVVVLTIGEHINVTALNHGAEKTAVIVSAIII